MRLVRAGVRRKCYLAVMRWLWSFIVVCLVAASGAARADVRPAPRASSLVRFAPPVAHLQATRHVLQPVAGRARAPEHGLSPAAIVAAFSLRPPRRDAAWCADFACERLVAFPTLTGSARGPPIA
jgi:hypothetical protein